jgi:HAD superfamily hydrolase (TIGR01509 family)
MLEALVFDLDGTLVDTDPIHLRSYRDVLTPYGVRVDRDLFRGCVSGRKAVEVFEDFLPDLSAEEQAALAEEKETRFRELASGLRPLSGLAELLAWSKARGLLMALVTNAPEENVELMLEAVGLSAAFSVRVLSDDLPVGKPDPLPYRTALHRLEISPQRVLAFEDSLAGVNSAVGAGIFTVGVATFQEPRGLEEAGAGLVVADYTDPRLWKLLADLTGATPTRLGEAS